MNKIMILAMIFALGYTTTATSETLKLSVETTSAKGNLRAAIYSSTEAFEKGDITTGVAAPAKLGRTELEIKGLEPGTYGVALFQDLNENDELDRNLLGAPNEPFGFSNNPIIRFSAPKFEEFKFKFDGKPKRLNIKLNGG